MEYIKKIRNCTRLSLVEHFLCSTQVLHIMVTIVNEVVWGFFTTVNTRCFFHFSYTKHLCLQILTSILLLQHSSSRRLLSHDLWKSGKKWAHSFYSSHAFLNVENHSNSGSRPRHYGDVYTSRKNWIIHCDALPFKRINAYEIFLKYNYANKHFEIHRFGLLLLLLERRSELLPMYHILGASVFLCYRWRFSHMKNIDSNV